jgi:hypothetical protein
MTTFSDGVSTSDLTETCDPFVYIEASSAGYVRYRNLDGRRWEVFGVCDQRGLCWDGAVGEKPTLDCPVTPEFSGCCPFSFIELDSVEAVNDD